MKKETKILRRIGKIVGIAIFVLASVLLCSYLFVNEKLPQGNQSTAADSLAKKMLRAVNHEAYKNTRYLEWTFPGGHHYKWDKQEHLVHVSWKEHVVHLNTKEPKQSIVLSKGEILDDDAAKLKIVEKAIRYFNNDSFWLVAPHKVFDPGTERRIVLNENGEPALLVTYTSGGSTPGDSYLWILDDSGLPKAFKLWVSILPVGGLEATWEGWKNTGSGTLLPTQHRILSYEWNIKDLKGWN